MTKWEPYLHAYHTHFKRFRDTSLILVEVGVQSGGSIDMWRNYFGPGLRYYGIDINPPTQQFGNEWATIIIGDQSDPKFWKKLFKDHPELISNIDIFIDDGGHTMHQQIVTFQHAFPHVKLNGVYECEDLATSYTASFGGQPIKPGHGAGGPPGSFISLCKEMIDWLHCHFAAHGNPVEPKSTCSEFKSGPLADAGFVQSAYSLHFYSQILIVEKARVVPPTWIEIGDYTIPYGGPTSSWNGKYYNRPKRSTL